MANYGATFEGRFGNALFSDRTPSIVFMGKAVKTSTYGSRLSHLGHQTLWSRDWYNNSYDLTKYSFKDSGTSNEFKYIWEHGDTVVSEWYTQTDTCRTLDYTVEAYDTPIIFTQYIDPVNYGGLVVKTEDSGNTGSNGWPIWTITVLLAYKTPGTHTTAANKIDMYCFSKMPANYSSDTHGLEIRNIVGQTMFHSDFQPCQIKEIMEITTSDVSSPTNVSDNSFTFNMTSTLLDPTGQAYGALIKPCFLSQDWGRIHQPNHMNPGNYWGSPANLIHLHLPTSIGRVSEDDFYVEFGAQLLHDFIFKPDYPYNVSEFKGSDQVTWPIIDGADYD